MARILIVDDDDLVRGFAEQTLQRAGHAVETALDGEQALRCFQAGAPDLVVMDVFMPRKDGLEAIREMRRERPSIKILAMSGMARNMLIPDMLSVAETLGAERTLPKPFTRSQLVDAVREMLSAEEVPAIADG